jgi:Domain of unknown function (DUF4124)
MTLPGFLLCGAFLLAITGAVAVQATESVLYKYVDATGRVTYSSEPPKPGETRQVTRLTAQSETNIMDGVPRGTSSAPTTQTQFAAKIAARDATIDALRGDIDAAKKKLAEAEAARDAGRDMTDDERQWTISRPDPGAKPDKRGFLPGRGGTVVCQVRAGPDGAVRPICPPVAVPNEGFYARQAALEKSVQDARQGVLDAEHAFRRNAPY